MIFIIIKGKITSIQSRPGLVRNSLSKSCMAFWTTPLLHLRQSCYGWSISSLYRLRIDDIDVDKLKINYMKKKPAFFTISYLLHQLEKISARQKSNFRLRLLFDTENNGSNYMIFLSHFLPKLALTAIISIKLHCSANRPTSLVFINFLLMSRGWLQINLGNPYHCLQFLIHYWCIKMQKPLYIYACQFPGVRLFYYFQLLISVWPITSKCCNIKVQFMK